MPQNLHHEDEYGVIKKFSTIVHKDDEEEEGEEEINPPESDEKAQGGENLSLEQQESMIKQVNQT